MTDGEGGGVTPTWRRESTTSTVFQSTRLEANAIAPPVKPSGAG
jgi:hypothetical protein